MEDIDFGANKLTKLSSKNYLAWHKQLGRHAVDLAFELKLVDGELCVEEEYLKGNKGMAVAKTRKDRGDKLEEIPFLNLTQVERDELAQLGNAKVRLDEYMAHMALLKLLSEQKNANDTKCKAINEFVKKTVDASLYSEFEAVALKEENKGNRRKQVIAGLEVIKSRLTVSNTLNGIKISNRVAGLSIGPKAHGSKETIALISELKEILAESTRHSETFGGDVLVKEQNLVTVLATKVNSETICPSVQLLLVAALKDTANTDWTKLYTEVEEILINVMAGSADDETGVGFNNNNAAFNAEVDRKVAEKLKAGQIVQTPPAVAFNTTVGVGGISGNPQVGGGWSGGGGGWQGGGLANHYQQQQGIQGTGYQAYAATGGPPGFQQQGQQQGHCYDWAKGKQCRAGSACRFKHEQSQWNTVGGSQRSDNNNGAGKGNGYGNGKGNNSNNNNNNNDNQTYRLCNMYRDTGACTRQDCRYEHPGRKRSASPPPPRPTSPAPVKSYGNSKPGTPRARSPASRSSSPGATVGDKRKAGK